MSTKLTLSLFLAVAWATTALFAAEPTLQPYASADGKFSIKSPVAPKYHAADFKDPQGNPGKQHQYTVVLQAGKTFGTVLIAHQDIPESAKYTEMQQVEALRGTQKSLQDAFQGRLVDESRLLLNKNYQGRQFTLEVNNEQFKGFYRARVFLAEGKMYQVVAMGSKDFLENKLLHEVINSFQVIK